jgi:hypothetical protein
MRRVLACTATAVVALAGAGIGPTRGDTRSPHVAAWVYDTHLWPPARMDAELARLPGDARRLYVSVESGHRLVLEDAAATARLGHLLDVAHGRGLEVEAMLLQGPEWAGDAEGAVRRIERALAFHAGRRGAGRPGFSGIHLDVEPHTEEAWQCADAAGRAAIVRGLQRVFAAVARRVAAEAGGLRVSAALPWWLGPLSEQVREAAPAGWLADLDEVVLMVYGDPGGPLVGETPAAVLRRVDDARLWADLPPGRGLRIGLASYEYRDAAALAAALRAVDAALAPRPGYRGLAVFAHGQPYDAPLVTSIEGRLVDPGGRPVAGVRLQAAGQETRSNRCGRFALRRLPAPSAEVIATADGFAPARFTAAGLVPGRHRELPPVVLEPRR